MIAWSLHNGFLSSVQMAQYVASYTATLELQPAGHFVQHIGAITYGFGNWDAYGCPAGFHIGPFNQGK